MAGKIVVTLDIMLCKRKMTLTEVAEKVGITIANMSILKTGRARAIRVSTLEKLCEILECQPGDLLEYQENPVVRSPRKYRKRSAAQTPDAGDAKGGKDGEDS